MLVELRSALNTMWEIPPKGGNGMLNMVKDRLLSLGMVLAVGFLLLVSLMVSAILAALGKYLGTFLPFPAAGLEALNFFMSLGGTTILFALGFSVCPRCRIAMAVHLVRRCYDGSSIYDRKVGYRNLFGSCRARLALWSGWISNCLDCLDLLLCTDLLVGRRVYAAACDVRRKATGYA